jgi:hypothetical protein
VTEIVMPESLEKILLLVLGWLLGLLAPVIVDAVRRRRENALGQTAIREELRALRGRLVCAAHIIEEHLGTLDRKKLDWYALEYGYAADQDDSLALANHVRDLNKLPDTQLQLEIQKRMAPMGKGLTLQKYVTPLLDARVASIWNFDTAVQRRLLEIRASLEMLSDVVDRYRTYSDMTFKQLDSQNHARVEENIRECLAKYANRARSTVDLIRGFAKAA